MDCMVALPTNLFYTVTIPACLWFISKNKNDGKTRKRINETLFIGNVTWFYKVMAGRRKHFCLIFKG